MAMAVDNRQHQQMSAMPYDQMRAYHTPHFTNPWVSAPAQAGQLYASAMPQQQDHTRQGSMSATPASSMPYQASTLPALSVPSGINQLDPSLMAVVDSPAQGYAPRPYGAEYPTSSATSAAGYAPAPQTSHYDYAQQQIKSQYGAYDRRASHPSVASTMFLGEPIDGFRHRQGSLVNFADRMHTATEAERSSFSDALDASRGMVAMSQDITPRNIYGLQGSARSSTDSYGFPTAHSAHSSISSASGYPHYYGSSVSDASSYGDYSSASESVDVPSRTLPRPNGLMGAQLPPAPQSMMGQFSSKVSSSSQKKHKCKICDKRFTRPSSLQTHMYSHTGEKRKLICLFLSSFNSNILQHSPVMSTGAVVTSPLSPTFAVTARCTRVRPTWLPQRKTRLLIIFWILSTLVYGFFLPRLVR